MMSSLILLLLTIPFGTQKENEDFLFVKKNESVLRLWSDFMAKNPSYSINEIPDSWHFCDNEEDANKCAELVLAGIKKATSPSKWWFKKNNERLPKKGDLNIVTNWNGMAQAIIETTDVMEVPFKDFTSEYAMIEGEGYKSLAHWKKAHWDYYTREMKPYGESPKDDMIIIFEQFKVVWK